jgi:predicted nucleic acid-binding protein
MAAALKQVAWDACTWIALIQREAIVADGMDRYTRCRSVIDQAAKGKLEIVCSALCIAEVCKNRDVLDADEAKIASYFEHEYLITSALGRDVAEKARSLMMSGISGLKPPDACHLATALEAPKVWELHTLIKDFSIKPASLQSVTAQC